MLSVGITAGLLAKAKCNGISSVGLYYSIINGGGNTRANAAPSKEKTVMSSRPEFDTELFQKGLEIRRAVVGDAYVDKSLASADDLTAPLQKLVTEYCWGEVWGRPGLDRKTRSYLNLGMLIALNRPNEVRLHMRGAINNGITREELVEVVLQAAIYCGVPASLDAMKAAKEVVAEMEKEGAFK